MENLNLSRRNFLKTVGVVSAGTVLAACAPAAEAPQQQEGGDGEPAAAAQNLVAFLGGWTPTESMERSEDNPNPHNKILEVLDEYTAEHPGVSIEWIRLPSGVSAAASGWWPNRQPAPSLTSCRQPNGSSKRTWTKTGGWS